MDTAFCIEAVEEAIERHGTPEIFNTDQGSQFTSLAFTKLLKHHDIRISMDGKGSWRDNVFVERLWRSVKYEEVYLKAYETVRLKSGSAITCGSITVGDRIPHLNGKHRIRFTSTGHTHQWRLNQRRQ